MSAEQNGRIRLSWGQIAWAISMMMMVAGAWADLRVQMAVIGTRIDANSARIDANGARILVLETRIVERMPRR